MLKPLTTTKKPWPWRQTTKHYTPLEMLEQSVTIEWKNTHKPLKIWLKQSTRLQISHYITEIEETTSTSWRCTMKPLRTTTRQSKEIRNMQSHTIIEETVTSASRTTPRQLTTTARLFDWTPNLRCICCTEPRLTRRQEDWLKPMQIKSKQTRSSIIDVFHHYGGRYSQGAGYFGGIQRSLDLSLRFLENYHYFVDISLSFSSLGIAHLTQKLHNIFRFVKIQLFPQIFHW